MRTYGDVIDVRTETGSRTAAPGSDPQDDDDLLRDRPAAPAQFVWRGRLYLVREVLAHWVELGTWWTLPRRAAAPAPVAVGAAALDGEPVPARSVSADVGAVEREVWRVEAASGRTATPGVYDLVRDVPAPDPRVPHPLPPRWRLARALD